MKLFEKISLWWHNIFRKRRLSIIEPESGAERWYAHLSPMAMIMSCVAVVCIVFSLLLLLVAYTPLLDMLPGYRTDATRSRQTLIRTLIRVDSLERKMNDMLIYNENRILVVDGKMPTVSSVRSDSVAFDKSIVPPSAADTLLRRQMENDRLYAISAGGGQQRTTINAVKPMDGIIAERFNAKVGLFGIRMAAAAEQQIVSIADGTVVAVDWLPESGNSIFIQHDNGIASVYRNLSGAIVGKGQRVTSGEVIGYSAVQEQAERMFEFEMWMGGEPLNPESYILF
ncbi:MAG: peptidoglycan DD-metalloendopeptidase family protein [Alistipes sp.]|nr:peptidoglycan DD-metalloendopeptidase family protein [Alistipes sp.]